MDAAVAASAMLCVVDPRATGIGGDLHALVWPDGQDRPVGLQAAGWSAAALSTDALFRTGFTTMPHVGPWTVTVPGSVMGWAVLLERFGKLGLDTVVAPAIEAAKQGFRVTPMVAEEWADFEFLLRRSEEAAAVFLPGGKAPRAGALFKNPKLAAAMKVLADEGPDPFYSGWIAERIAAAVCEEGGPLTAEDIAQWGGPVWVDPLSVRYRDVDVYELPPPNQGLVVLETLALYQRFDMDGLVDQDHVAIEAMKIARADAARYVCDPGVERTPAEHLLSDAYIKERALGISMDASQAAVPGELSDTVYVAVADRETGGCSLIQSIYDGFGSGVVPLGLGYALQNRGANFTLEEGHPNRPAPHKRPYHTLIPAMLGRDARFAGSLGVVGGFMQPQGQFQIVRNIFDRGMEPQEALDAPRFRVTGGRNVDFERGYDWGTISGLTKRGHAADLLDRFPAGGAQLAILSDDKVLGATDPRKDGTAEGL